MPSRKQRRKRQKDKRHEYEYVYVDDEGRELDVDDVPEPSRNGTSDKAGPRAKGKPQPVRARGGRIVQPASWQRAARRGVIFAPFMFGILYFLNRDLPLFGIVLNTLILLAFFVPFGYLMDRMMYRAFERRSAAAKSR